MTFDDLKALMVVTLRDPAQAVAWLRGLNLPMGARWMALAVAVCLSAAMASLASWLFPVPVDTPMSGVIGQPMVLAVIQFGAVALAAAVMAGAGQMMGGRGSFADALLLAAWIEFMLLVVQSAQVVLMLIFPAVATVLGLAAVALFLWLTVQFTKALHGFELTVKVVLALFVALFVAGAIMSIVLSMMGLMPEVPV